MWKQSDKIEMLKVECLNNSLWNHLDKTIVGSIVQRLESDRMRQKKEKHHKGSARRFEGRWKVKTIPVCWFSFPPGGSSPTTEHPPLATCQMGRPASFLTGRSGARQRVPANVWRGFFQYHIAWEWTEPITHSFLQAAHSRVFHHEALENKKDTL